MDPRKFDDAVKKLAQKISRRSLVKDATAAGALIAAGIAEDVVAQVSGESHNSRGCLPTGRRCGTKKHDRPCNDCCQRHFTRQGRKKRCACKPNNAGCGNNAHCCSGICQGGVCVERFVS